MFFHVLVEGLSDVPTVRQIMVRSLGVTEGAHFRIHPHKGKGMLPARSQTHPDLTLLGQLPATLRAYASKGQDHCIVVLVDADRDDCSVLKQSLVKMWSRLSPKPPRVLFRIAVEEMESWFIADPEAIREAYPTAELGALRGIAPDAVVGAWERLAEALSLDPRSCSGADKEEWAVSISPHLNLDSPKSPSLRCFIEGLRRHWPAA